MSYQYHGTTNLIALPNRTVQTYPSGLVRVERSFVCRKDRVERFRNTIKVNEPMPFDDGAPAIDGLYIFPEPQELVRDDGFAEFRVTAYGRTNIFSEIAAEKSSAKKDFVIESVSFPGTPGSASKIFIPTINDVYTVRGVLPTSTSTVDILKKPAVAGLTIIEIATGVRLVAGGVTFPPFSISATIFNPDPNEPAVFVSRTFQAAETTIIELQIDGFASTNFGRWSEFAITWVARGSKFIGYVFISETQEIF